MDYINLYYRGDIYRIIYDPDALVVTDIIWYCTPSNPVSLEYSDLDPELQDMVDRAVRS